jgi:hypothetical protein
MATEYNIETAAHYFTGEDKAIAFTVRSATGAPQDMTGWSVSWLVKASRKATATAVVSKTTDAGIDIAAVGQCIVQVSAADLTPVIAERFYYHELTRTDAGLRTVLSYGTFRLLPSLHGTASP